jgi:hypothetical protein
VSTPNRISVVERAKAALEGVTEGPWRLIGGNEWLAPIGISVAPDDGGVCLADAEFVAAARSLVPELVDYCQFLESEYEDERDRAAKHFDARITAETRVRDLEIEIKQLRGESS